ncbi:MAG TPA: plastocyanin/azurin family copper-binding protein [Thermoanaerobaculia bacterium]
MTTKSKTDWMARSGMVLALALSGAAAASAETVTLPVAASATGQGGVPFVSDVRVFNTSYANVLNVTAVYRFNGMTQVFQLAAREARGFDDICVSLFSTPQSLGAVEFSTDGAPGQLVVTSQLRSPSPGGGHVGMFVPGLPSSAASAVSVLTSLVNGDSRTNVGVYNPNGTGVTATIRLYDGNVLLGTSAVQLGAHAVTQVNNIYGTVGFASLVKTDGYATVESSGGPLFTYAAEADNATGDLILIVGAADQPAPAGFNAPTATPTGGVPAPTPTPTPPAGAVHVVNIGQVGTSYTDSVSGTNQTTIHVGDTVKWVWQSGPHSTTSGTCTGGGPGYAAQSCDADGKWESGIKSIPANFSWTFNTAGTFKYFCDIHLDSMMGTIQVNP